MTCPETTGSKGTGAPGVQKKSRVCTRDDRAVCKKVAKKEKTKGFQSNLAWEPRAQRGPIVATKHFKPCLDSSKTFSSLLHIFSICSNKGWLDQDQ